MPDRNVIAPRRALVSVSNKTGLVELGLALVKAGVAIVSTGSTAATLREAGVSVADVSDVTGFREALDGRVKTLHPAIHGGILADVRKADHRQTLEDLGIEAFELVIVNLYPFQETVASGAIGEDVIEQIDIGGPAMVRAAAKNHASVAIVVDPARYPELLQALENGGTTLEQRIAFAGDAFWHTAQYDSAVAGWFAGKNRLSMHGEKLGDLRYGENSHQAAAVYGRSTGAPGLAQATVLQGKEMSYNNYLDADAAVRAAYDHEGPAIAIIKHQNPCGIATAATLSAAHQAAHACDPVSAFGGVIACNRELDRQTAESIREIFTEVIVAPSISAGAREVLGTKPNLRLVELPPHFTPDATEVRLISGGFLVQDADRHFAEAAQWTLVAGDMPDALIRESLEFAWRSVRAVKSNAILLATGTASVGIGMGQVNRVDSCQLAVTRAGDRAAGSVAASDAFFPFADGLQILIDAGVRAVVQPGGSVRDAEVIDAAKAAGITMFMTGERHFFH